MGFISKLAFPNSFKDACNSVNLKYNFNDSFKIKDYEIYKLLVDHGRMKPAYGYIFKYNDVTLGFTGDTTLCKNVELMAEKCKYLFCDCMLIKGTSKHQGIDNLEYLSRKYTNCTFITSHMDDITREELKKLKLKNVVVPEDDYILEIE